MIRIFRKWVENVTFNVSNLLNLISWVVFDMSLEQHPEQPLEQGFRNVSLTNEQIIDSHNWLPHRSYCEITIGYLPVDPFYAFKVHSNGGHWSFEFK